MYKTVLITGASRGIGRAIACAFAREGCRLVINCSHSEKELLALADELRAVSYTHLLQYRSAYHSLTSFRVLKCLCNRKRLRNPKAFSLFYHITVFLALLR